MPNTNSTIFTIKNKEFAIFGKTIGNIQEKWNSFVDKYNNGHTLFGENGAFASLFSAKGQKTILDPKLLSQFDEFKEKFNSSSLSAEALAKQMDNVNSSILNYAKTCKNGKMTTEGFKASINDMSFSSKAGKAALQALATAGNMAAMWLISKGIEFTVKELNELIHASEIARETSSELTEKWTKEKSSLDQNIAKYKELKEKLDDTSLSALEVKSIKEELLTIQDSLTEKYGQEALGIDLVNGKYDEQIAKLNKVSKLKAQEYVAENYSNIQEDQKYVSEKINLNERLGFNGSQAHPDD